GFRLFPLRNDRKRKERSARELVNAKRQSNMSLHLTARRRSLSPGLIKGKMRLSQSLHYALLRSTQTNRQLCRDLPRSNGRRVSNVGTSERLSTARIIP